MNDDETRHPPGTTPPHPDHRQHDHYGQHRDKGLQDGASQAGPAAVDERHAAEHPEPRGHGGHQHHAAYGGNTGHGGHGGHSGPSDHAGQFRRLFWIMLLLAVPVIGFSGMFSMVLGYPLPDSGWVGWISPLLGSVMYVWGGRPFLTGAVDELRRRQPGMMLLIGLAITVAFLASWAPASACCTMSSTSGGSWRC